MSEKGLHLIADDLGVCRAGFSVYSSRDWLERWDCSDVEEYLGKHAAFAEYVKARDTERSGRS